MLSCADDWVSEASSYAHIIGITHPVPIFRQKYTLHAYKPLYCAHVYACYNPL